MKKTMPFTRKTSEAHSNSDGTDAPEGINYTNFYDNSSGSEKEFEFSNPTFKYREPPSNSVIDKEKQNNSANDRKLKGDDDAAQGDYDKLGIPLTDLKLRNQPDTNNYTQMGVKNYGYVDEKPRPDSWNNSLSPFNPYAVDTPIRDGVPIPGKKRPSSVDYEMGESPPRSDTNKSTKSDYSSIYNDNPYTMANDRGPQYEDLAGIRASAKKESGGNRPSMNNKLPAVPSGGIKKSNMLYEPAVISQKTTLEKRTSVERNRYEENSSCCHLMFTTLTMILAITALVLLFLLLFGGLSVQKCKDCEVKEIRDPTSSTQTSNEELNKQLAYLKSNLSLLQSFLNPNTSATIITLQNELKQQQSLVASLLHQLDEQKNITTSLNNEITAKADSADQKISQLQTTFEKSKYSIIESFNNHTALLTAALNKKVGEENFTNFKNNVTNLFSKQNDMITKTDMVYRTLLTNVKDDITKNFTTWSKSFDSFVIGTENKTTELFAKVQNISVIEGPRGPRGYNGSSASTILTCETKIEKSTNPNPQGLATAYATGLITSITGVSCGGNALETKLFKLNSKLYCECSTVAKAGETLQCQINYTVCTS